MLRFTPLLTLLTGLGCSLDLPEIAVSHPGNASAASGLVYSTPGVLEVHPVTRPADMPMTRPAHRFQHEAEGMTLEGETPGARHEHQSAAQGGHAMHGTADTRPAHGQRRSPATRESKGQMEMQREGQLHDDR